MQVLFGAGLLRVVLLASDQLLQLFGLVLDFELELGVHGLELFLLGTVEFLLFLDQVFGLDHFLLRRARVEQEISDVFAFFFHIIVGFGYFIRDYLIGLERLTVLGADL